MCLSSRLGTLNCLGHDGHWRVGAKEGGGETPSSSSSLLLVDLVLLLLLYVDDKVAKLVSETPAGKARPALRAYRRPKRSSGSWDIKGATVNSLAHQIYLTRSLQFAQKSKGILRAMAGGSLVTIDWMCTQSSKVCLFLLGNKVSLKENRGTKGEGLQTRMEQKL